MLGHEALKTIVEKLHLERKEYFARPISWQGSGEAVGLDFDMKTFIKMPAGEQTDQIKMITTTDIFNNDWEVISQEQMLKESEELNIYGKISMLFNDIIRNNISEGV